MQKQLLEKAEDVAEQALRISKPFLPALSRILLVSSFFEDGYRMIDQFSEQANLIGDSWKTGAWFGYVFVTLNMLVQWGASLMIIVQKQVQIACFSLAGLVFLQNIIYLEWFELVLFLKSLGLLGGVLMLFVDARSKPKASAAGLLAEEKASAEDYVQLVARALLALMLLNMLTYDFSAVDMIANVFVVTLLVLVALGWKTKVCALAFIFVSVWRMLVWYNFWSHTGPMMDYLKYKFFQTLSCVGGFLLVIRLGPGYVSLDALKKRE